MASPHRPIPRFRLQPIAAAACSLAAVGFSPVGAQPVSGTGASRSALPTVTVTAPTAGEVSSPKSTAPLVDTPQTISVIPQEVMRDQGARNLTEVLRNTPGISFNAGENGFGTNTNNFSMRGFDASGSIYVDGVRDSGNFSRDAFNLEQVEVIKGPASDNGRGNAGGYVNLETKTPKAENFISGTLGLGFDEYDAKARKRATADINRVLGNGTTAWRLNLLLEDSGMAGREHAKQKSIGIAPSVAFGLGTPTNVVLAYQHIDQDDRPDWGVPAATIKGTVNYDPAAGAAKRDRYYGLLGDTDDVRSDALMARVEHRFSPSLKLSNQTRWSRTDRDAFVTAPTGYNAATQMVATQRWGYTRENTTLSNLTNLSHQFDTGALKHNLAVGLELTREESKSGRHATPSAGSVSVFDPDPGRLPGGDLPASQRGEVDIRTVAVYGYDTVELNPQWQLTGGVRVERYKVELASKAADGGPQGPMDGYGRSETTVGGKLGLVYKPASNGSVYVAYSQSGVPPGSWLSNPDSGREGNNAFPGWDGQNYEGAREQKLVNFELGTKWEFFDRQLTTTAALFRTERRNVAMRASAANPGEPSGYGKQTVQGLELGIAGAVTRDWSVFGGLVVLDSKRSHSAAVDAALSSDYGAGITTTNGDQLAFTPKFTANLWTTYRLTSGLTLGGGLQHVSSVYVGRPDTADRVIPNGQSGKVPSYTTFGLMAAYEVTQNLRLRVNLDNVFDKDYVTAINWSAQRAFLGAPRTVLLSADLQF